MPYPARFYAALHAGTPGDLDHYVRVCKDAASVLELGCGYGRVVKALAAPGRTVVGVERDPELLAMARTAVATLSKASQAGIELVEGDMRTVSLDRRFAAVLIPFGGLYCLLDDADLDATLANVVRHLEPDGCFAFDVYRADAFHAEAEPDDLPDDAHAPLARVEVDGEAYEVLERSSWDKPQQRIDASYLYVNEAGRAVEGTIEQRYLLEPQLRAALARAGLEITRLAERFEAEPSETETETETESETELMVVEAKLARR